MMSLHYNNVIEVSRLEWIDSKFKSALKKTLLGLKFDLAQYVLWISRKITSEGTSVLTI